LAEPSSRCSGMRRRAVQVLSMLIYNADVSRWFSGGISRSSLKHVCVPGLNCYSCPGAIASCPLGSLQNTIGGGRFPFFVTGFLLLAGTLLGRMVCAFLCPAGLVQELLYKIPVKKLKKTPRVLAVTRRLSLLKYALLVLLCAVFPLAAFVRSGAASPYFCKFFCPAGTLGAGIPLVLLNEGFRAAAGRLFAWKVAVAAVLLLWSAVFFRPFCTFFCPLGAVYSFFNRIALAGIRVDAQKCLHCGACTAHCRMQTLTVNDRECIRCGDCIPRCPHNALSMGHVRQQSDSERERGAAVPTNAARSTNAALPTGAALPPGAGGGTEGGRGLL